MGATTHPTPRALDAIVAALAGAADRIVAGEVAELELELPCGPAGDGTDRVAQEAARLIAAVRRSHALEAAVHELFEALSHHLRLDYLAHEALNRVVEHTGAEGGAVVLLGDGGPDVAAAFDFAPTGDELTPLLTPAVAACGPVQLPPLDGRPLTGVPFAGDAGPLGAVLLSGVTLEVEITRLLALLARALGFAVSNALAHAALERRAATDALTGCANRGAGLAALEELVRRARLGGPGCAVLLVDLDHFKAVNDTHGHPVGDEVLRRTGAALSAAFRDGDVVMRYGGEEFAVAIAGADAGIAAALAERVRACLEQLDVRAAGGARVAVTASVGVACWRAAEAPKELIDRADRALYEAKAAGRNRVVAV